MRDIAKISFAGRQANSVDLYIATAYFNKLFAEMIEDLRKDGLEMKSASYDLAVDEVDSDTNQVIYQTEIKSVEFYVRPDLNLEEVKDIVEYIANMYYMYSIDIEYIDYSNYR